MQVGNVFVKIVMRRLQAHSKAFQFMLLAGYDPRLSHTTATYVETLSPAHVLTQQEIDAAIEKARVKNAAAGVNDVTNGAVANKLAKMFAEKAFIGELQDIAKGKTFAQMGIGQYL
jgi:hypothetical protein